MAPPSAERAKIVYTLSSFEASTHRANFSLEVRGIDRSAVDVILPVWAPGAYEIRETAREIRELRAVAPESGRELRVERVEKNRWRVHTGGAPEVEIRYVAYGHDLVDDGFDVSEEHVFLTATRCFPWVEGRDREPLEVVLNVPAHWKVYAELPRLRENPTRLRARDYEELVDTPIEAGTPVHTTILPGGIPHHLVFCGPGNYELHRVEQDVQKIVEAQMRFMGVSPLSSYTFLFHLTDRRDGGLEHLASTSIVLERNSFRPLDQYDRFLSVVSHEYFHLYNVKRIRPKVLGPFDFNRENYTHLLWWMEGTTDYVSDLLTRHAGVLSTKRYLAHVADLAKRELMTPGRHRTSLEAASYQTWVDLYRPFEETRNQSINYYVKGHLVSLGLDLEIRTRTQNERSLETVFRYLWKEYGAKGRGLEEGELQPALESATGLELGEFFDRYVRGTVELPLDAFARQAGLTFGPAPKPADSEDPDPGYLGIETMNEGGRAKIREVLDGTPARQAGLSPGDEIVAFDGGRVLFEGFADALKRLPPGTEVEVTVFRRGLLRTIPLTTGAPPAPKYVFRSFAGATDLEKRIHQSWLDAPWEAPKPDS
jgi:predicted metalloprotease with PDZ domain